MTKQPLPINPPLAAADRSYTTRSVPLAAYLRARKFHLSKTEKSATGVVTFVFEAGAEAAAREFYLDGEVPARQLLNEFFDLRRLVYSGTDAESQGGGHDNR
jgi:hypothetical protein